MTTRTVVTRTRRGQRASKEFSFTREMALADRPAGFVSDYRTGAWEDYQRLAMPTTRDEPWRRTDIRALRAGEMILPKPDDAVETPPAVLLKSLVSEQQGGQITMTPQGVEVELDPQVAAQGVVFTDLATAERENAQLLEKIMGQIVRPGEGKFAALAAAMARQGVLLYVPRGVQVEKPLHSVFWGPGLDRAHFSHLMVYVEDGAAVTFVHEAASPSESDGQILHAGVVEIHVGAGANLRFVELQSWGENVWNFSHERARVSRDGNLDWVFGAIGSRLTKNFSDLDLIGRGSSGRMSGFYFTDGDQHLDHDTQQNHLAEDTTSDLLFKGALKDTSRSVWQGMIYVAEGAQKTDGYQANRNLILSKDARADSIPGLEIMADDVRCTHGATAGQVDADQIFYLLSRGIPKDEAERLIVKGFFDPIMQRIPFDGVRSRFQHAIDDKME